MFLRHYDQLVVEHLSVVAWTAKEAATNPDNWSPECDTAASDNKWDDVDVDDSTSKAYVSVCCTDCCSIY